MAFVTSTPFSVGGGSGTYVGISRLARALGHRNIRVEMQFPTWWSPSLTLQRILFNLSVSRRLRGGGYDWIVGFDLDGFHYGRAKTAPYVASIKGVLADELTHERGVIRGLLAVQAAFERSAVRRADVVVATSRYSRSRIVEAYAIPAGKVVVVPELIDLEAWEEAAGQPAENPAEPPAILTVAHMYPRKNLGVLLRAFGHLRDAGVPFQGWVVGDGPRRRAWERLRDTLDLRGQVTFLGTIPHRELVDRYRRAAVFCLPSRQEGFGIVFLEAMACGKPVVAGRAGAAPETVAEGETGWLVDPGDSEALAGAVAGLLADPGRRHAMGRAGRRRVEQYRAERVAASFLTTVQAALEASPGPRHRTDVTLDPALAGRERQAG